MNTLVLFLFLILSVLGSAQTQKIREIRIGLASNFSGVSPNSYNALGVNAERGATLALRSLLSKSEKKHVRFILEKLDYGTDPKKLRATPELALQRGVEVVVGYEFSDDALIAAVEHQRLRLPMFSPSASADRLSTFGSYVHLGSFSNTYQSKILSEFAYKNLAVKTVVTIVNPDCAYCVDAAHAFNSSFEALGGKVLTVVRILSSEKKVSPLLGALSGKKFDALFIPNQELASRRLIDSLSDLKLIDGKILLGTDGWRELNRIHLAKNLAGLPAYMAAHWTPDNESPESQEFVRNYKLDFGEAPTDSAVLMYDAIKLVGEAILEGGTKMDIESSLNAVKKFKGLTGIYKYTQFNRSPAKSCHILKLGPQGFVRVKTVNP